MGSPQGDLQDQEQHEEQQEELTAEQLSQAEAEESAAFAASFGEEARGEEPPVKDPEQTEGTDGQAQAQAEDVTDPLEAKAEEQAEADDGPAAKAGVTEEQLMSMLAKLPKIEEGEQMTAAEIRKLHGKFGEINRALQELQKNGTGKPALNLATAKFKRLQENFPELAEMLAEDLNESAELGSSGAPDVQALVDEKVQGIRTELETKMEQKMQMSLLKIQHRDCFDIYQSDDFKVWKQTLPAEEQQKIEDSWDAEYLGQKLTEFKSWRDNKSQGSEKRRSRLERAITPKGVSTAAKPGAMTEEDGFNAAFKTKR
jgi:hypothetical protein